MYLVAHVDTAVCSETACKLCTQFCPEANTILYDNDKKTAFIAVDRCKACEICVSICDNMAKHNAIKMIMITDIENAFSLLYSLIPPRLSGINSLQRQVFPLSFSRPFHR